MNEATANSTLQGLTFSCPTPLSQAEALTNNPCCCSSSSLEVTYEESVNRVTGLPYALAVPLQVSWTTGSVSYVFEGAG